MMRKLRRLAPNAERELADEQMLAAKELASDIRSFAPVRTGKYRASIEGDLLSARRAGSNIGGGMKGGTKDPNATGIFAEFVWRFLEFGTVNMSAQPHIFPTYRANKKKIRRRMNKAVRDSIKRSGFKQ